MNLLHETIEEINRNGRAPEQIVFIGSEKTDYSCTWEEFKNLADQEYDNDYGAAEVAIDLIIIFDDGAKMWRSEYDGAEWWTYFASFKMPAETKPITSLFTQGVGWDTLADINEQNPL